MTPDEVKQSITTWCTSDDDLEIGSDRFEPGTDFSFGLKAGTLSTAPVDLIVLKADGADRVTIRRSVTLPATRSTPQTGWSPRARDPSPPSVERSGADTTIVAQTYVYLDGLSKHTFVQAVAELARTSTLLDAIGGVETASVVDEEAASVASDAVDTDPEPDSTAVDDGSRSTPTVGDARAASPFQQPAFPAAELDPVRDPGGSAAADAELHATAGSARAGPPAAGYSPQPAQAPSRHSLSRPSRCRNRPLPVDGRRATRFRRRDCARGVPLIRPDPVVANLAPGLPIQVAEVRGAWARVICSNGWTGWIDGRIIGVAA